MIYGLAYVERDGGEHNWRRFLEFHNLKPIAISQKVIDYIGDKIRRDHKEDCIGGPYHNQMYLIDGSFVWQVEGSNLQNRRILVFQSNSEEGLEKLIKKFHLPTGTRQEPQKPAVVASE